ncbi:sugar kinase [Frondihabitans sucicola]|uniref:Sugar kinase n=1 Tax=Frondihabitans sucicola TaxID=1268041 RepID=A0ABN6Y1M5_9MICO|nr:carbohydrate kinase family protein [Frondihabitans sucicola]BDZ49785.1 sugar kinase [Frondihabitans sucicola]
MTTITNQQDPAVLVVGDANVDLVLTGDVVPRFGQEEQLLDSASTVLGSSAGIVAHGLARLGVPASLVACVGDDEFGRFTLQALGDVDTTFVRVVPGETTGLSVILSAPADRSILTSTGAMTRVSARDVLAALDAGSFTHVHFASYFLLPGLAASMPVLLPELRRRGLTISLDTNWDPAARWEGLDEVLPLVDVFLPNLEELRAVSPGHASDARAAAALAATGPTVVVKAGKDGGWSVRAGDSPVSSPGLLIDVVDTTGAGDSFDAGYLAALVGGIEDEGRRLGWATTAGSLSTRSAGGTAAQATRDEILMHLDAFGELTVGSLT